MSPAKASTSTDTIVTSSTASELMKPASQTDNKKDEAAKKAVDFGVIVEDQLNKSKLCDEKIKLEVSVFAKLNRLGNQ